MVAMTRRALIVTGLLVATLGVLTSAAVIGIDYGSESFKVALVKPGKPFQIVENTISKRKTPNVVSFYNGQRYFEEDAQGYRTKQPANTLMFTRHLLGKTFANEEAKKLVTEELYLPYDLYHVKERDSIGVRVKGDTEFSIEEVNGQILRHVRSLSQIQAQGDLKDCVITVPPYFTHFERKALIDAAELAGLNVLSLIHENTAAALHYSLERLDENATHTVAFYNLGASALQVSIAQFRAVDLPETAGSKKNKTVEAFNVKSHAWDTRVGGHWFDLRLAQWFSKDFVAKHPKVMGGKGVDTLLSNPRSMAKMINQAKRVKEVLSANKESPIFVEGLYADTDYKSGITRGEFEELCADLFARLTPPLEKALADAGLTLSDLDGIELIGGSVRVPRVIASVTEFAKPAGKELVWQHLNGDEAMALGAAFHAANVSTAFRVRKIGMADVFPFAMGVRFTDLDPSKAANAANDADAASSETIAEDSASGESDDSAASTSTSASSSSTAAFSKRVGLFSRLNRLGSRKTVSFSHDGDLLAVMRHDDPALLPSGTSTIFATLNVSGAAALAKEHAVKDLGKPRISLTLLLSPSGVMEIIKAEASLEESYNVTEEVPIVKVNATAGNGTSNDTSSNTSNASETDANATNTTETAVPPVVETEKRIRTKKRTFKVALSLVPLSASGDADSSAPAAFSPRVMSVADSVAARLRLDGLDKADQAIRDNAQAKNTLEAFLYSARDALETESHLAMSTADQREAVTSLISEIESWLNEGDGFDAVASEYTTKLAGLKKLTEPIAFRVREAEARPQALAGLTSFVNATRHLVKAWNVSKPWINITDRNELLSLCDELDAWVKEMEVAQAAKAAHEEPAVTSDAVFKKSQSLVRLRAKVEKTPRPKPPATPKGNSTKNSTKKESADSGESADASKETAPEAEGESTESETTDDSGNVKEDL